MINVTTPKATKYKDISDKRFGKLVAINYVGSTEKGHSKWLCKCDCGVEKIVLATSLAKGATVSCGCHSAELTSFRAKSHGMSSDGMYAVWNTMIQRCCNDKSSSFENYGGRGINVCARWRIFENFYSDMGKRPSGMTIERKDNDGDYCPENCCWASREDQAKNKRDSRNFEFNGEKRTLAEICIIQGVNFETARKRLQKGWPIEKAVSKHDFRF